MRGGLGLPLAAALWLLLVATLLACPVPVLDEESYLAIGAQLDALRPYDWWRPWPPWGGGHEADAFVYAHPPAFLWWVGAITRWVGEDAVRELKGIAGAPFALLLGLAGASLARQLGGRPGLGLLLWGSAPMLVLGAQRGLMPDLAMVALGTAALALWRRGEGGWQEVAAGLFLAVATWVKYPSGLLLLVVLLDARLTGRRPWRFLLGLGLPLLLGEGWLWAIYGRLHLWEVLSRAGEIPRGPLLDRLGGVAVRLAVGAAGAAALGVRSLRGLALAGLVGIGAALFAVPPGTPPARAVVVGLFAAGGAAALAPALRGLLDGVLLRLAPARDEAFLGAWVLVVVGGVALGHNFAAPRYLMGAALPLALLIARRATATGWLLGLAAVQASLAATLTLAEHRFALAADEVAGAALTAFPAAQAFTGEWTARWRWAQSGLPTMLELHAPGAVILVPTHSGPAPLPEGAVELGRVASADRFPLKLVDARRGVGLYGETLGVLPLAWTSDPLEEVSAWRLP